MNHLKSSACYLIFSILVLCLFLGNANAQEYLFDIQCIGQEQGLPAQSVVSVVQDLEGFIWVSTRNGVHRYDGKAVQTWTNVELNMPESVPLLMAIDSENRMWYANRIRDANTGPGGILDLKTGELLSMDSISGGLFGLGNVAFVLNPDPNSHDLVIVTHTGTFYAYNGQFEEIITIDDRMLRTSPVCRKAPEGGYWIVNHHELMRVEKGEIKELFRIEISIYEWIWNIFLVEGRPIIEITPWVENRYLTLEKDKVVPFSVPGTTPQNLFKTILLHSDHNFFATQDSFLIKDPQGTSLFAKSIREAGNTTARVFFQNTLQDNQGNIWVTSTAGLFKLTQKRNPFTLSKEGESIYGFRVRDEEIWTEKPPFEQVQNPPPTPYPDTYGIMQYYEDLEGRIWMSWFDPYLNFFDPATKTLTYVHFNEYLSSGVMHQNPTTRHLFVGTQKGAYRVQPQADDPSNYKLGKDLLPKLDRNILVQHFYQNEEGIWITTDKGIFLVDDETEKVIKHISTEEGLPVNNIAHLHEDADGVFWLASQGGGLIQWTNRNQGMGTFRSFTTDEGISHNSVSAVYEDDSRVLWLSTNYGLTAFDKETFTTRIYLPRHGIAHSMFNSWSHYQAPDGKLYFGGEGGITSFYPRDLNRKPESAEPPLLLTNVKVLEDGSETFTSLLDQVEADQVIQLKPDDQILTVEVSLLDYENSSENQYAYRLAGKQDDWVYTREPIISLMNLPYGSYELQVKAHGPSGNWTENILALPIQVQKPIYLRLWFMILVLAVIAAIATIAVRWRIRALEKDRKRLETEVAKRTEKIVAQAEELKELDRIKSRFFANVTHEFRTPLTLVIGPTEQLIENPEAAPFRTKLRGVLRNARNLMGLISQLLDLGKLESKQMALKLDSLDITKYTRQLVEQFQPLAKQLNVNLSLTVETPSLVINLDADKWEKTVNNLLSNALKFTPKNGVIEVSLTAVRENSMEYVQLEVKDTGFGIEKENLDRIFDRFYQADSSSTRVQGGTGIGLSLVKELVELQKGVISVESSFGEGSAFTVRLPIIYPEKGRQLVSSTDGISETTIQEKEQVVSTLETLTPIDPIKLPTAIERLSVLLVEDNPEMRSYIRSCLDESKYEILEAEDGEQGLDMALNSVPDLIISDVMMPKMDGFQFTRSIREHIATSHIPLILLTAKASLESRLEGLKRGADAYLTKPFSTQELNLRVEKLIGLRALMKQRYSQVLEGLQETEKGLEPLPTPDIEVSLEAEDEFILELKNYLSEHYADPDIKAERMCKHFGMSRTQFYRKLKSLSELSLGELTRVVRCEKALELIQKGEMTMSEIAFEVGFSSPSYFTRNFKAHFGKTPSEMIK